MTATTSPDGVPPGRVILLNGTTSSGKSSVAAELIGLLDRPYFHMPVDGINAMRADGWAEFHFTRVHVHGEYDVECDSGRLSARQCAERIVDHLGESGAPQAFRRLRGRSVG